MKKTIMFVDDKVVIRTERQLSMLVKNERSGNFLAMDEEGNLYSNDEQGMVKDLQKEDIRQCFEAWVRAQGLLDAMLKLGVRKI